MKIEIVKSKIHRVKVTGADLNYIGSITIDKDLMDAANIIAGEKIHIVNNNNPKNPDIIARSTNLLTSFTLSTFKIIGRRSDENNPKRTKNSRDALSLVLLW